MGLDIFFEKHRNSSFIIEENFRKFYETFREDMPLSKARKLAKSLGLQDKIEMSVQEFSGQKYVYTKRTDVEDVAYFRKHNHLLPYFGYKDNCTYKEITKAGLQNFINDAKILLDLYGRPNFQECAEKKIQTCSGFFFGNVEYDEGYKEMLLENISAFEKILSEFDFEKDMLFMYCWW